MAHTVKCAVCGQHFDRDKEPFVQIANRRYAHKKCADKSEEEKTKEQQDKKTLEEYIKYLFNTNTVNAKIQKQIQTYMRDYKYTYSGIYKTLKYFFEVKKNPIEKANDGIGIVPYTYDAAYNYYYALWEAQQLNLGKSIDGFVPTEEVVHIDQPHRKRKKRKNIFSFLDKEEVG